MNSHVYDSRKSYWSVIRLSELNSIGMYNMISAPRFRQTIIGSELRYHYVNAANNNETILILDARAALGKGDNGRCSTKKLP